MSGGQVIWIGPQPAQSAPRAYPRRLEVRETFMGTWEVRIDDERRQFIDGGAADRLFGQLIDPRMIAPFAAWC